MGRKAYTTFGETGRHHHVRTAFVEMGRKIWITLLVLALTTVNTLQFAVINDVATPDDGSQKSTVTWRRSGEYRCIGHLTCFLNFKI